MSKELIDNVQSMLGNKLDPALGIMMDALVEQAPVIGKVITSYKIHRLGVRLKNNEEQINDLREQVSKIEDQQFVDIIKNFIFPTILQELLDEDEDNKIGYFLDGFGQTIKNKVTDKDRILIFYDILKKLRFIELEYLISLSNEYVKHKMKIWHETKDYEDPFDTRDFREMKYAIENKLESLGLINTGRLITYEQIMKRIDDDLFRAKRRLAQSSRQDKVSLTSFGYKFLNFFYLLDKYTDEAEKVNLNH